MLAFSLALRVNIANANASKRHVTSPPSLKKISTASAYLTFLAFDFYVWTTLAFASQVWARHQTLLKALKTKETSRRCCIICDQNMVTVIHFHYCRRVVHHTKTVSCSYLGSSVCEEVKSKNPHFSKIHSTITLQIHWVIWPLQYMKTVWNLE